MGAPLVAPGDPEFQDLPTRCPARARAHWLGTDRLGRDVLSRLLYGGQVTLVAVAEAVRRVRRSSASPSAWWPGTAAAGRTGSISRVAELRAGHARDHRAADGAGGVSRQRAPRPWSSSACIGCPLLLRVIRGVTSSVRGEPYVKAARLSGLGSAQVMRRHVLPRLVGPIIVQLSLFAATAVLVQAALSFLGLARPESEGPSWGNMVGAAAEVTSEAPWLPSRPAASSRSPCWRSACSGTRLRDARADRIQPAFAARRAAGGPARARRDPGAPAPRPGALLSVPGSHRRVRPAARRGDRGPGRQLRRGPGRDRGHRRRVRVRARP